MGNYGLLASEACLLQAYSRLDLFKRACICNMLHLSILQRFVCTATVGLIELLKFDARYVVYLHFGLGLSMQTTMLFCLPLHTFAPCKVNILLKQLFEF